MPTFNQVFNIKYSWITAPPIYSFLNILPTPFSLQFLPHPTFVQTTTDRLSESQAALERKAALYDRLASGQATDNTATEHYEVDFLMKGFTGRGVTSQRPKNVIDTAEAAVYTATGGLLSSDMAQEQERRAWEARLQEESIAEDAKDERLNIIEDLERQTREGRDRAAALRQERQSAEARKRERLKAEFLQRRLQMAKGGDNQKK